MRRLAGLFEWIGFIIQYFVPLILFSDIIPFVVENPGRSITVVGYVCLGFAAIFLWGKLKKRVLEMPKSGWRALILSVPPVLVWVVICSALGFASRAAVQLGTYWHNIIIYIVIGRIFIIVAEILHGVNAKGNG